MFRIRLAEYVLVVLMTCGLICAGSIGLAATDGSLGSTSTGTSNISIEIPYRVRISDVNDIDLGTWSGSGNLTKDDDICIYLNDPNGTYKVTAVGSGDGGAFLLSDSSSNVLPYSVQWNDQKGSSGGVSISANDTLTGQTGACATSSTCSDCGLTNANFLINITPNQFLSTYSGSYTGNISFLIEPD